MTSVMALTSGLLASVIVNWKALSGAGMMRICLIFMSVMIFVMILLLSSGQYDAGFEWEGISMAGEGGGYICGIFLGMILMPHALQTNPPFVKKVRMLGVALAFIYTIILVPVFFFSCEP